MASVIGCRTEDLKDHPDHPVWERVEHYLATLCANVFLITSVERIVIGGGVAERKGLVENVNEKFLKMLNGFILIAPERGPIITKSRLGDSNGILGAAYLHVSSTQLGSNK